VEKEDETTREQDRDDYRGGPGYRPGVRKGNMEKVHLFDGQTEAVIR
jgi:hypothetical protein